MERQEPEWYENRHSYCHICKQWTIAPWHEKEEIFYCVFCGHCIHHEHDPQEDRVARLRAQGLLVGSAKVGKDPACVRVRGNCTQTQFDNCEVVREFAKLLGAEEAMRRKRERMLWLKAPEKSEECGARDQGSATKDHVCKCGDNFEAHPLQYGYCCCGGELERKSTAPNCPLCDKDDKVTKAEDGDGWVCHGCQVGFLPGGAESISPEDKGPEVRSDDPLDAAQDIHSHAIIGTTGALIATYNRTVDLIITHLLEERKKRQEIEERVRALEKQRQCSTCYGTGHIQIVQGGSPSRCPNCRTK